MCLLFLVSSCQEENLTVKNIDVNWEFKAVEDTVYLPAKVPGTVHSNLLTNGVIEDPFFRMNEKELQWIDKKDWEYQTVFNVDKKTLSKDKVQLEFKGLDTYAAIYLNDSLLLTTNNMFLCWEVDCKQILKSGKNHLKIVFQSPINKGLQKRANLGYQLPNAVNDQSENGGLGKKQVAVFSRKPGYHFGWDWGPRLVTSGVWQEVYLKAWDKASINDVYIKQQKVEASLAEFQAEIAIEALEKFTATVEVFVDGVLKNERELELTKGLNQINVPLTIKNPELWWTNGLGTQKLYDVKVVLKKWNGTIAKKTERVGIRNLQVVQKKDKAGESFYFELNGHPVFMKGANYIPQDVFLDRVTVDDYKKIIQDMVAANYNMIRVWGGGIYEKDIFYDLCDEHGILVWQDFMFACAMYPGNDSFLENVKKEATYQVKRLRNHPSIALWCGNNENLTAWENWGWKNEIYNHQGKEVMDTVWKAYTDVFHDMLPKVVKSFDEDTFYWASSPTSEMGKDATLTAGDYHYWGVWGQQSPFETFDEFIPRFMSEYGFQSFPEFNSVEKFTKEEDWDVYSEVMQSHQRHPIGNKNIAHYMQSWYRKPKDFDSFLYVSQLLQAQGMQMAIEAHRRNMPYCMGSLYWQINDCWPVASWSTIDYYGKWKAAHFKVKDLYKALKGMFYANKEMLEFYIVSDALQEQPAKLHLKLIDFRGEELYTYQQDINIKSNRSQVYFKTSLNDLLMKYKSSKIVLQAQVLDKYQQVLDESLCYFEKPKDLDLTKPTITKKMIRREKNEIELVLKSDVLVKNVKLVANGDETFSNNYFDMLPEQEYTVKVTDVAVNAEEYLAGLRIESLLNTFAPDDSIRKQ